MAAASAGSSATGSPPWRRSGPTTPSTSLRSPACPSWSRRAGPRPPTTCRAPSTRWPGTPVGMGTLAAATLAAGLSATQRDHRLHAVDAFLDLVPAGRIRSTRWRPSWRATRRHGRRTGGRSRSRRRRRRPAALLPWSDLLTHLLPQLPARPPRAQQVARPAPRRDAPTRPARHRPGAAAVARRLLRQFCRSQDRTAPARLGSRPWRRSRRSRPTAMSARRS